MKPTIFGFIDSYTLMVIIGIVVCLLVVFAYLKKVKFTRNQMLNVGICACFAIGLGFVFALLFQNLYDLIAYKSAYKWTWAITFYGGLFGGVLGFLLVAAIIQRKEKDFRLKEVFTIGPVAITIAHGFGRIGCFMAGCCYGRPSEEHGLFFPVIGYKAIPTQLYEACFLFLLAAVLIYLVFKKKFDKTIIVYMFSYSTFRFIIEFFRGDPRGASSAIALSPSQIWSIIIFVAAIPFLIFYPKLFKGETNAQ